MGDCKVFLNYFNQYEISYTNKIIYNIIIIGYQISTYKPQESNIRTLYIYKILQHTLASLTCPNQ